jgi:hypothetical protein
MNKNEFQPSNTELLHLNNLMPEENDLPASSSKEHNSIESQNNAMVINDDFELEGQPSFSILQKRLND